MALKPPCDEGVVRTSEASAPCALGSGPWILAATILGSAMAFIDGTVVNVALPEIQARLGATAVDAQWIVESYALLLAALILVGGSLGDHFGRRRIFALGIVLFAASSVWCGIAGSPEQLIFARAVQGVGGALLVPGSLALGAAALVAFVLVERRVQEPMMPLSLFRSRNFSGANLLTLFLYAGLGGALYFLPFNLIQVHGYSATAAGSAFLPFVVITFVLSRWAGGLVGRYGAKLPLVIGPTIAAAGFILFALPGAGGSYWTTFFPAIVVLGLGMALVIAPLTTTAMNSVSGRHSGLASGVNNAVSRTGSLLAIPVLGIFVFTTFSASLDARTAELDLPQAARQQLEAEKVDLGGAEVPQGLDGGTATAVERAVDEAFVTSFRIAMLVAAGLALASAVAAGILIEGKGQAVRSRETERVEGETVPA
jgi:MFS family permease